MLLTPAQIKPKSFESRRNSSFLFFLPGVDAPQVYVRAWALGCFRSLISTQTFWRALTKSGRLWRKGDGKRCSECGPLHQVEPDKSRPLCSLPARPPSLSLLIGQNLHSQLAVWGGFHPCNNLSCCVSDVVCCVSQV